MTRCSCGRLGVYEHGDCDLCAVGRQLDALECRERVRPWHHAWLCAVVRKLIRTIRELEKQRIAEKDVLR